MNPCPRCNGSILLRYGLAACVNCGYEPSDLMVGQRCMACLDLIEPPSKYTTCSNCRPQTRNLKRGRAPSAVAS